MSALGTLRRSALTLFACAAVAATSLVSLTVSAAPAQAAPVVGFQAGNIIDDALFYDRDGMTSGEIQRFLERKVPRCTIGDAGRTAGSAYGSTKIAKYCLRDFSMKTSSKAANENCTAYSGRASETAAQIIRRVAQACGINPKVLLITLEKEQSLVTDTWPTVRQYDRATGYDCPDSGPGGSANCSTAYAGFFNQVYHAGRQLQNYRTNAQHFNFRKGQSVAIQYHPKISCGTKTVSITGHATAALYNYTPYQPNTAALAAGWGTGNSCSSYGNRNFYNFWTSWFGSVRVSGQMTASMRNVWEAVQASGTPFGYPVTGLKKITANGGGYQMEFENGVITQSSALGKTYGLRDPSMVSSYLASGGASGKWGFLTSNPSGSKAKDNRKLTVQNGTIIHSTLTEGVGLRFMPTRIYTAWQKSGGREALGLPNSNAAQPASAAASQRFTSGSTIMAVGSLSTVVSSADMTRWQALGGYAKVGYYRADPVTVEGKTSRRTNMGTVYFPTANTQMFLPTGAIHTSYTSAGGPSGAWGWPTAAQKTQPGGGSSAAFEGGVAVSAPGASVARLLTTQAFDNWISRGGATSSLGYPTSSTTKVADGSYQRYKNHLIFFGPDKTVALRIDPITAKYMPSGKQLTGWGWPIGSKKTLPGGGSSVEFTNGVAVHSGYGTMFLTTQAYDNWLVRGGASGSLGYPTKHTKIVPDGSYQQYRNHLIFYGPDATRALRIDPITNKYLSGGKQLTSWGWPIGGKVALSGGGSSVVFSTGVAVHSKLGTVFLSPSAYSNWMARGGPKSVFGYPKSHTRVYADGSYQRFAKHYIFYGPEATVAMNDTRAVRAYLSAGGPTGSGWGWPLAREQRKADGSSTVQFSNGLLKVSRAGKVTFVKTPKVQDAEPQPAPVDPEPAPVDPAPVDPEPAPIDPEPAPVDPNQG